MLSYDGEDDYESAKSAATGSMLVGGGALAALFMLVIQIAFYITIGLCIVWFKISKKVFKSFGWKGALLLNGSVVAIVGAILLLAHWDDVARHPMPSVQESRLIDKNFERYHSKRLEVILAQEQEAKALEPQRIYEYLMNTPVSELVSTEKNKDGNPQWREHVLVLSDKLRVLVMSKGSRDASERAYTAVPVDMKKLGAAVHSKINSSDLTLINVKFCPQYVVPDDRKGTLLPADLGAHYGSFVHDNGLKGDLLETDSLYSCDVVGWLPFVVADRAGQDGVTNQRVVIGEIDRFYPRARELQSTANDPQAFVAVQEKAFDYESRNKDLAKHRVNATRYLFGRDYDAMCEKLGFESQPEASRPTLVERLWRYSPFN